MKWFDRWLHKKMKYLWENSSKIEYKAVDDSGLLNVTSVGEVMNASVSNQPLMSDSILFKLYRASGGYVVEISATTNSFTLNFNQNPINQPNPQKLFVIPDNSDLGEELSKIIMMESLRR